MSKSTFTTFSAAALELDAADPRIPWLWDGYIAGGNITLLTSQWKAGKTTLLTGLLRAFAGEKREFLGLPCELGPRTLIVSEETRDLWAVRNRAKSLGPNAEILPRPFPRRPTLDQWNELIDYAIERRSEKLLDLLVIDPLASFLPGRCESDAGTLLEALQPLHRFTSEGGSVLLLHHPRKKPSDEGSSARGSGSLLGFVDVVMELHHYGNLRCDVRRRRLVAQSRHANTVAKLGYEWNPATGEFAAIADPQALRFRDNWTSVEKILKGRKEAATHQELLMDWPGEEPKPTPGTLYEWLNRAYAEKRIRRVGQGRRSDPFRYRLSNEDDKYYDRGELPPIRFT